MVEANAAPSLVTAPRWRIVTADEAVAGVRSGQQVHPDFRDELARGARRLYQV
jgi:hypothetical protein